MTIIIGTFNGEGYSDPQVIRPADVFQKTLELISEYLGDYTSYVPDFDEGRIYFDDGEDQGAITSLDLPYDGYHILEIRPDINDVSVLTRFKHLEDAEKHLKELVELYGFDEDEVKEFFEEGLDNFGRPQANSFGGHTDEGFVHFEIVGNSIPTCSNCGEEFSEEQDPDFCPHCLTCV